MKKLILVAVVAVSSLTLFSFRTIDNNVNDAQVVDVNEFAVAAKNFVESAQTFPDKFTKWRRTWTDYNTLDAMNVSLDDVNRTLNKY